MKTVLMLRNNDTPEYDSRMCLQKEALEEAGYNVHQLFLQYKRGIVIWHVHGKKIEKLQFFNELGRLAKDIKIFVPYKNYSAERMLSKYITTLNINPDIIHAHNQNTMALAIRFKKQYKAKLIYDMREYWPEMAGRDYSPVVKNFYWQKERFAWKNSDWIFAVEQPMADYYIELMDYKDIPITVVGLTKPLVYKRYRKPIVDKPMKLTFLGTIGKTRMIEEGIDVVEEFNGDVKFYIGGYAQLDKYYNNIVKMCSKYKHSKFIGVIPHEKIIPFMRDCHAIYHMVNPEDFNGSHGTSNKQFEAWVAGRPIIATRNTYSGLLNGEYGTGPIVPYCKKGIRYGIRQLLEKPHVREIYGKNGMRVAKEEYNWDIDKKRMLKAYEILSGWS